MSRDKIQNSEQEGLTPSTGGLTSLGGSPTDSLKERGLTHAAGGARPGSSTLGAPSPSDCAPQPLSWPRCTPVRMRAVNRGVTSMRTGESSGTRDPVIRVLVSRQLARPFMDDILCLFGSRNKSFGGRAGPYSHRPMARPSSADLHAPPPPLKYEILGVLK